VSRDIAIPWDRPSSELDDLRLRGRDKIAMRNGVTKNNSCFPFIDGMWEYFGCSSDLIAVTQAGAPAEGQDDQARTGQRTVNWIIRSTRESPIRR
jgi:hypothetical protein